MLPRRHSRCIRDVWNAIGVFADTRIHTSGKFTICCIGRLSAINLISSIVNLWPVVKRSILLIGKIYDMQKIWVDRYPCWQKCTVMLHESALSFLRHCRKLSQSTIAAVSPMQLLKRLSPPGQDSRTLRIKPDRGYTCNQWQRIVYHALSHDPCYSMSATELCNIHNRRLSSSRPRQRVQLSKPYGESWTGSWYICEAGLNVPFAAIVPFQSSRRFSKQPPLSLKSEESERTRGLLFLYNYNFIIRFIIRQVLPTKCRLGTRI